MISLKRMMAAVGLDRVPFTGEAVGEEVAQVEAGPQKYAIEGWPSEAEATVKGLCVNPRLIAIEVDGKPCSMWKERRNLRWGQVVRVRLANEQPGNPIYEFAGGEPV